MDPVTSIVGLVVVLTPAAWALARLVTADGGNGTLLHAHPDLGWPRGVQEDDDVHWRWERPDGPALRQPPPTAPSDVRPPAVPLHAVPLRLPAALPTPDAPRPSEAEIVDGGVAPVDVRRVRRGR